MDSIERAALKLRKRTKDVAAAGHRTHDNIQQAVAPAERQPSLTASAIEPPKSPQMSSDEAFPKNGSEALEIDIEALGHQGYISPLLPVTRIAEEFRVLKQKILFNIASGKFSGPISPRLIMVTSTQPREGKSFAAINLAMSIATERDTHVLLVDGDFSNPSIFRTLRLKRPEYGFLDVLQDQSWGLENVVYRTNIERLSVVDSGRSSVLSSEFLSSQRMRDLCEEIANRYADRIIIFDTPPILATSEASVLSHNMGQILYVVEARRTSQSAVKAGLDLIHDQSKVVMVLNKSLTLSGEAFSGYYSYYRKDA